MSSNFYECYLIEKRRLSLNRERRQDVYGGAEKKKKKKKKIKKIKKRKEKSKEGKEQTTESTITLRFRYESQWLCFIFLRRMTLVVSFTCNSNDTAIYLLH